MLIRRTQREILHIRVHTHAIVVWSDSWVAALNYTYEKDETMVKTGHFSCKNGLQGWFNFTNVVNEIHPCKDNHP